jgi:predicted O-methyltransferase YrrM
MANARSFRLPPEIHEYLVAHGTRPDDVLRDLIDETNALGGVARMQISPEQGAFMTMLTSLIGARQAIEIGTFTGYSSLCVARGLPPDGRLLCCDQSDEWTSIARRYWDRGRVADKIELRVGPALDTLDALPAVPTFDLAFIDADKSNYLNYLDRLIPRVRTGGLILVDNVLWSGSVIDDDAQDVDTVAIRRFNDYVVANDQLDVVMLPVGDGLSLIRPR